MPGEVLDQLVSLIVREIGKESRGQRGLGSGIRFAGDAVARETHQLGVRHGQRFAEPVEDLRRRFLDRIVLELAQVSR